jgi:hypothetical protein
MSTPAFLHTFCLKLVMACLCITCISLHSSAWAGDSRLSITPVIESAEVVEATEALPTEGLPTALPAQLATPFNIIRDADLHRVEGKTSRDFYQFFQQKAMMNEVMNALEGKSHKATPVGFAQ